MSVPQGQNNARRAFIVADATDITARKVYVVDPVTAVPNARRLYPVTPADPTAIRIREVAVGTPGAWPVYYVDANGAPASNVLHRSTFTAPDGTALSAYAPEVGGPWTDVGGAAWGIQSNQARKTTASAGQHYTRTLAAADCAVGVTIAFGASGVNDGLIVRATALDSDGYILAYVNGSAWAITDYNGAGGFVNLATTTLAVAGTTGRMVVLASGPTVTVYWNGVQILTTGSATRNQTTGTRFGLRSGGASNMAGFDNVVAYAAGAVSVPAGVV